MAHQSGIRAAAGLVELFHASLASPSVRAIKVSIRQDAMEYTRTVDSVGTLEQDFALLQQLLDPKTPCFICCRLDSRAPQNPQNYAWLLVTFVPDTARVRDKMVYAASRQTLLKDLGDAHFSDALYATQASDVTFAGYSTHVASCAAAAPLTNKEREMAEIRRVEVGADIGTTTRRAQTGHLQIQLSDAAQREIARFRDGALAIVALHVAAGSELVELTFSEHAGSLATAAPHLSDDQPAFILSRSSAGNALVYYCPGRASIRFKMLYSSVKAPLVQKLETALEKPLAASVEIDDRAELSGALGQSSDALAATPQPAAFGKPAKPGRGPAKLIR